MSATIRCDYCGKEVTEFGSVTTSVPPAWIGRNYDRRHPNDADESMRRTVMAACHVLSRDICEECWQNGRARQESFEISDKVKCHPPK